MDKFTVSEVNLINIFAGNSVAETISNILTAIPDFDENDMIAEAEQAIIKLDKLSDSEFFNMNFAENFTDFEQGGE